MKRAILLSLLIPALANAENVRIGFDDLKNLVDSRNERVQAVAQDVAASKSREGGLGRSFFPTFELHAAQEAFKKGHAELKSQPTYGVEARVNLYNGGRDRLRGEAQSLTTERREAEKRNTAADELAKARDVYWRVLYTRDVARLIRESLSINSENLKAASRRIRSGVATASDRLEFEMSQVELKRELEQAELDLRSLQQDLLVLTGYSPSANVTVHGELAHAHEWESQLKHTHDDHEFLVRPAELLAKEAEVNAKEKSRSWVPRVEAYAAWNQYNQLEEDSNDPNDRQEGVLGVRLRMDFFDRFTNRQEAQALRAEAKAAELLASYSRKETEVHVDREFMELRFLHGKVHEADQNIKRAETYYRLTQSEYSRGVKNSPDVLGASEKLFEMKRKRLEIIRDFQIARSHILTKIGK